MSILMKPCFASIPIKASMSLSNSPVKSWLEHHKQCHFAFSVPHQNALSRLIPLLICGEQSSQWVFYKEKERVKSSQSASANDIVDLERIVSDEICHEQALSSVLAQLPAPDDIKTIRRRSQVFFAGLGKQLTIEEHYAQIVCLDSWVCKLMLAIEKSALPSSHPFVALCRCIKQDEAKHVSIAKKYAKHSTLSKEQRLRLFGELTQKLHQLLSTERQAFFDIGVDIDALFIDRKGQQ
jgi:hypothetical protein